MGDTMDMRLNPDDFDEKATAIQIELRKLLKGISNMERKVEYWGWSPKRSG